MQNILIVEDDMDIQVGVFERGWLWSGGCQ